MRAGGAIQEKVLFDFPGMHAAVNSILEGRGIL